MKDLSGTVGFFLAAMATFRLVYGAWPPSEGNLGDWLASDPRAVWALVAGIVGGIVGTLIVRHVSTSTYRNQACEVCGRRMRKLEVGKGYVMLDPADQVIGIGVAEHCWECGRLYCDNCYPSRPPNTCICGKGRDAIRNINGVVYQGSLKLIKVRYLP